MPIIYEQQKKQQDQDELDKKQFAELKEKQNQILRKFNSGETKKISKADFDCLQALDRLRLAHANVKIIGG